MNRISFAFLFIMLGTTGEFLYLSDRERMAEVEAVVIENNVTDFILGKAKISDKQLPFDELMATA